jgi:hypothetical protein
MWDLQTLIALNRQRQEEYDKAHPREAAERIAEEDEPLTVPRTPGRTGPGRGTTVEGPAAQQSELAGPLAHTLSLYLQ